MNPLAEAIASGRNWSDAIAEVSVVGRRVLVFIGDTLVAYRPNILLPDVVPVASPEAFSAAFHAAAGAAGITDPADLRELGESMLSALPIPYCFDWGSGED